ncbi:MAG TPA: DUF1254 domain-containing protein [Solirubrobacteraceae bacterium]|nr:DUF1254 domain-containing protein [Solirubrobacteraceae bacterium]
MARHTNVSATDAAAVAADGFVFGYPLVLMDRIRAWMTAVAEPDPVRMRAPLNRLVHARELPEATAGRPPGLRTNALRSCAWLDLDGSPVILSVPAMPGRFYALSLVDLWTDVFASVGARTTGTTSGTYAIVGPRGDATALPPGAEMIRAPTRIVRIAGLTQVDGDGGCAEACAVQDAYGLKPLHAGHPAARTHERPPVGAPPIVQVERMDAPAFFSELAALMRDNPPRLEDRAIVDRIRRLGLLDGDLGWGRLGRDVRRAVAVGAARGLERVVAAAESPPGDAVGEWHIRFRLGQHGTDYLARAGAACAGLEAGPAADELPALVQTDVHGRRLSGRHRYVLTFPPRSLPPVHGFWTLTTYDARETLVDNPVERYSIGDWNGLVLETDGALAIRIQHADPGARVPNWLPAPPGAFNLLLHLRWPQPEVLDRVWTPPAVTPVGP